MVGRRQTVAGRVPPLLLRAVVVVGVSLCPGVGGDGVFHTSSAGGDLRQGGRAHDVAHGVDMQSVAAGIHTHIAAPQHVSDHRAPALPAHGPEVSESADKIVQHLIHKEERKIAEGSAKHGPRGDFGRAQQSLNIHASDRPSGGGVLARCCARSRVSTLLGS